MNAATIDLKVTAHAQFHYLSKSNKHSPSFSTYFTQCERHWFFARCAKPFRILAYQETSRNPTDIGSLHVAPNHSGFLRIRKRPAMFLCTLRQTIPDHCGEFRGRGHPVTRTLNTLISSTQAWFPRALVRPCHTHTQTDSRLFSQVFSAHKMCGIFSQVPRLPRKSATPATDGGGQRCER